jgi:hypothetical protein
MASMTVLASPLHPVAQSLGERVANEFVAWSDYGRFPFSRGEVSLEVAFAYVAPLLHVELEAPGGERDAFAMRLPESLEERRSLIADEVARRASALIAARGQAA